MAQQTKAGVIFEDQTTTEFKSFAVPLLPTVHILFISITGTMTVDVALRDGVGDFIGVKQVTTSAIIRLGIPCTEFGINVTASSGSVTVTYRGVVVEDIPDAIIETFTLGEIQPQTIITQVEQTNPDVYKKVFQGFLTTTVDTLYTVPASTQSKLRYMVASNTTGSARTFELYHDGATAAFNILPTSTLVAGGYAEFTGDGPLMEPADTLRGKADSASAVTLTVYAIEQGT